MAYFVDYDRPEEHRNVYGYFVPTFVRRIAKPEAMDTLELRRVVRTWTRLSPLRILVETFAWITGIWALVLAAKG